MNSQTRKTSSALSALQIIALISTIGVASLLSACSSSDVETGASAKTDVTAVSESSTEATIWTCSMHPQIRMLEPGNCPICGMELIPATTGEDTGGERSIKLGETARKLASIQVTPVERHVITRELRMVGVVEYDETTLRNINAWIPGRLDKLVVNFTGVTVEKGEPMVEIYSPELISAQEELLQAIKSRYELKDSRIAVVRESAESTINAAKEKLRLWGITREQIAEVERTGEVRDHFTIYAPVKGVVITRNASEGDYVKAGSRIFTLADLSTVWLSLDAYESDIDYLRENQEVTFTTNTYPGETFVGIITFIDPTLNPRSRTVRARVEVNNEDGRLKPGMFANAIAYSDLEAPDAGIPLVIPASAPLITGKRALVYVQDPNDPALFSGREVTLGPRSSDRYIVKEGLLEGEKVVTNGAFKIDAAMQIQAKPSMMYASGNGPKAGHDHGAMKMSDTTASRGGKMDHSKMDMTKQMKAPKDLTPVFDAYFEVQEALRSDNLEAAKSAAKKLVKTYKTFCADSLTSSGHTMFDSLSRKGLDVSTVLSGSSDIAAARAEFVALTSAMTTFADHYGMGDFKATYEFFCPMADGGKGANWLQRDDNKQNPYFGSAMSKCGTLKRVIGDTTSSDDKGMDKMKGMKHSSDSMEHKGH